MREVYRTIKIEKATYNERWETIYAAKDMSDQELAEFKASLIADGYKVLHVVKGKEA